MSLYTSVQRYEKTVINKSTAVTYKVNSVIKTRNENFAAISRAHKRVYPMPTKFSFLYSGSPFLRQLHHHRLTEPVKGHKACCIIVHILSYARRAPGVVCVRLFRGADVFHAPDSPPASL